MEWINGEVSRSMEFNPNIELYRYSDEVYDEIVLADNQYMLIKRCGVEPFSLNHSHQQFVTDGNIIIYPLSNPVEEPLEFDKKLSSFSELTQVRIIDGEYVNTSMTLDIDRRYIEYTDVYSGNRMELAVENYDPDRPSYLYKIKNNSHWQIFDASKIPSIAIGGATVTNNGDATFTVSGEGVLHNDYNNMYDISDSLKKKIK